MGMVRVTIDGRQVEVPSGTSILSAARSAGIYIPALCHHPDLPPAKGLQAAKAVFQGDQKIENTRPKESGKGFMAMDMTLLRKCPCPVWLMKPIEKSKYNRVLAAVDFDPPQAVASERAFNNEILDRAAALGQEGIEVELDGDLNQYRLPVMAEDPLKAMRASLQFIHLAPFEISAPVWRPGISPKCGA